MTEYGAVFAQATELSLDDRIRLIEDLEMTVSKSINDRGVPPNLVKTDDKLNKLLARRSEEVLSGKAELVEWDEFSRRIRNRIGADCGDQASH